MLSFPPDFIGSKLGTVSKAIVYSEAFILDHIFFVMRISLIWLLLVLF